MEAPVFIGGVERSGTSMIRAVIGSHPEVAIFEYDLPLWRSIYPAHQRLWGEISNRALALRLLYAIYRDEKFRKATYQPDRREVEEALEQWDLDQFTDYVTLAGKVFEVFLEQYRILRGRKRWGLKTPTNEFFADEIFMAYPDAKFIHVYRNVFSVISSLKKLGWIPEGDQHLARRVIEWNRSIETLVTNLYRYQGRYLGIRYENFVEDPQTYLRLICGFLEIAYDEEMLKMQSHPGWQGSNSAFTRAERTVSPALAYRPTDNLSEHERSIIQVLCRAYGLYMQGKYPEFSLNRVEAESLSLLGEEFLRRDEELARLAFHRAIEIDPSFQVARRYLDMLPQEDKEGKERIAPSKTGEADQSPNRMPDIIELRPHVAGVNLVIRCRICGHVFECYQPTMAGVALGRHICPQCQTTYLVGPEEFIEVVNRLLPPRSFEEMRALDEEVIHVTGAWYRVRPVANLLTYKGVNLGEPTERELASFIMHGLYVAQEGKGHYER